MQEVKEIESQKEKRGRRLIASRLPFVLMRVCFRQLPGMLRFHRDSVFPADYAREHMYFSVRTSWLT
jgi:hypothetical protein